jgi:hypothetical protein
MRSTRLRSSFFAALLGATAAVAPASAQSPSCDRIRSELAMLDQSGGAGSAQYGREIQRQRTEADRLSAYARSIGCQNRQFLIFGSPPPAQCPSLEAQISRIESNVAALENERARSGTDQRRAQLAAAYDSACRQGARPQPGFLEGLFGAQQAPEPIPQEPEPGEQAAESGFSGSYKTLCVRKCDGFYYPMGSGVTQANFAGQADLCHAACPGADAELFIQQPNGDVASAVTVDGTPYSALPNAFRYRQVYDATCACRNKGQSWSEALAEAEKMLAGRSTDVTVTEEKAQEMSRAPQGGTAAPASAPPAAGGQTARLPGAPGTQVQGLNPAAVQGVNPATAQQPAPATAKKRPVAATPTPAAPAASASAPAAAIPTAGQETSGIGSTAAAADPTLGVGQGEKKQVTTTGGQKKTVRVVAPPLTQAPPAPAQ